MSRTDSLLFGFCQSYTNGSMLRESLRRAGFHNIGPLRGRWVRSCLAAKVLQMGLAEWLDQVRADALSEFAGS